MKRKILMCAPFNTRSGYGDHARSIFYSIMDREDFEIKCVDVRWGSTPRNHLDPKIPKHKKLLDTFVDGKNLERPDIYIDIRIPNEFQTPAKFNIGITAGVEADICSPEFVQGCNKMDLVLTTSRFTKETFMRSVYDQVDNKTKQSSGEVKVVKPMGVLSEGIDTNIYKPIPGAGKSDDPFKKEIYDLVKESFLFLHVGQWGKGGYGEDRKNIALMIKTFIQAFANQPNPPALLLKTNGADFSILDRKETVDKIKQIKDQFKELDSVPNIYLLHGDLTLEQMALLYNLPKVKAMLSCTHGEGFGRPLAEATCCDLPVIASNWSGQLDFLNPKQSVMIDGELKPIPKKLIWKPIIVEPGKWFNVHEGDVVNKLRLFYKNHKAIKSNAKKLGIWNRSKFSLTAMAKEFNTILDNAIKSIPETPQPMSLKLPKLTKKKNSKPATIKLPKLKKVT
jgi:hypothetical protein